MGILSNAASKLLNMVQEIIGSKKEDELPQGQQHKTGDLLGGQHQAGNYYSQGYQINQNHGGICGGLYGGEVGHGLKGDQCQGQGGRGGLQGDQSQGEGEEGITGKIKDKLHGGQGQDGNKKKDGRDSSESD